MTRFLFPALLALATTAARAAADDPIDLALARFEIEKRDLRPDLLVLFQSRDALNQTPLLRACIADPLRAPWRIGMQDQRYRQRTDAVHRLMMNTTSLAGIEMARGYIGNPLSGIDEVLLKAPDPLVTALGLIQQMGAEIPANATAPSMTALPNPFRFELARLIATTAQAEQFRRRALRDLPKEFDPAAISGQLIDGRVSASAVDYRLLLDKVEPEALAGGMLDLTAATEDFTDYLAGAAILPEIDWRLETSLGVIRLNGSRQDHDTSDGTVLLLVDLYGNDHHRQPNTPGAGRIQVAIDREGNDVWDGPWARGVLGYGIAWDVVGDDQWTAESLAQGAAAFGCALLVDGGGNDVYTARSGSQGYAVGGAALVVDREGDDRWTSVLSSQASGGPRGAATLLDLRGTDVYTLSASPLLRPSPQLPESNCSMGQGCGWGLRADLSDGRSLSGGTGLLIDAAGDDIYTGQVICQGAGFLEGVGALVDHEGNDVYTGAWYAQAAGAHRAVGILIDRGGDDSYTATHYTSVAAAHDNSIAALVDEGGNDRYTVRNLGLGGANDGGFALLLDATGDDVYTLGDSAGHGLGSARITHYGTTREGQSCVGLFFDLAGVDTYNSTRPGPAQDSAWSGPAKYPELNLPAERGAGLDGIFANPIRTVAQTPLSDDDEKSLREALANRRAYRTRISTGGSRQQP